MDGVKTMVVLFAAVILLCQSTWPLPEQIQAPEIRIALRLFNRTISIGLPYFFLVG
jgi:hypothetical protein